jgi:uncharacterized protein (TIGR03382 family)
MLVYAANLIISFSVNFAVFWFISERLPHNPRPWWTYLVASSVFCVGWVLIVSIGLLLAQNQTSTGLMSASAVIGMILAGSFRRRRQST